MSSDVFIISSARNPDASVALRQAVELGGVSPARIEDAVFGLAPSSRRRDLNALLRRAGLSCTAAAISPAPRSIFFAAGSILAGDTSLSLAAALERRSTSAFLLASAEMVGRLNLLPRARLAARSLAGPEAAARAAGLAMSDIELCTDVQRISALHALLDELEARLARWGLLSIGPLALLLERV